MLVFNTSFIVKKLTCIIKSDIVCVHVYFARELLEAKIGINFVNKKSTTCRSLHDFTTQIEAFSTIPGQSFSTIR